MCNRLKNVRCVNVKYGEKCIFQLLSTCCFILTVLFMSNANKHIIRTQEKNGLYSRFNSIKNYEDFDVCIVGAGLSGAVIAERYASTTNKSILVMEKRNHIGGNCYDYVDNDTGIRVSKYGAHIFHTKYKHVWDYVKSFDEWISYEHKVRAFINGKYVPIPVNIDTVNSLFDLHIETVDGMKRWLQNEQVQYNHTPINSEEMALSRVGERLYELIFKTYTVKQWNKTPAELEPTVLARIPVRNNWDDRYFSDPYQALPRFGYTSIFSKMLKSSHITIRLNSDFFHHREHVGCGKTFFTGPIDRYYDNMGLPKLEYRSLQFERKVIRNVHHFQPGSVVNYPNATTNYTRIVEYKWFPYQDYTSGDTVIFTERSTNIGEPYYPVPSIQNQNLYKMYKSFTEAESGIHFLGRLANYKYFNMDEAIKNALDLFKTIQFQD